MINLIDMVIQNIGPGPARNVRFRASPDFAYDKDHMLSGLGLFKKGLHYLAPNQKIQFFFTSIAEDTDYKTGTPFEVTVTCQDTLGKIYSQVYTIDLSELAGLAQLGHPPLHTIADTLARLEREIRHFSTGHHKLRVMITDPEQERERWHRRIEQAKVRAEFDQLSSETDTDGKVDNASGEG